MTLIKCTASIVVYNSPPDVIRQTIQSLLACQAEVELHVVDNSRTQALRSSLSDLPITYHFSGANLGYGRGHNKAILECSASKYHVVINPDIILAPNTIQVLTSFMEDHPDIGMVCPRVLNADGTTQYLNKRYPSVLDLFARRFIPAFLAPLVAKRIDRYEMKDKGYDTLYDVEAMTGAFMFCRMDVLKKVGGFDPRYFMYFEDFDLSRRFQEQGFRTVYYPGAVVTHLWERAAHKKLRMTAVFIMSMFRYFNKWGWKLY